MQYMAKKPLPLRIDADLLGRVDVRRKELGQTRTMFVERALEAALGDQPGSGRAGRLPEVPVARAAAPPQELPSRPQQFPAVEPTITGSAPASRPEPAFDAHAAALERQRKLNEKKGL